MGVGIQTYRMFHEEARRYNNKEVKSKEKKHTKINSNNTHTTLIVLRFKYKRFLVWKRYDKFHKWDRNCVWRGLCVCVCCHMCQNHGGDYGKIHIENDRTFDRKNVFLENRRLKFQKKTHKKLFFNQVICVLSLEGDKGYKV